MTEIIWEAHQVNHIENRNSVSKDDFDQAWHDEFRQDLGRDFHKKHGPYFVNIGSTENGIAVEMVWRWQGDCVWPITAFFPSQKSPEPNRGKRKGK